MATVVVIRKLTTGDEAERLITALEEKVGHRCEREGDVCSFSFLEQPGDWEQVAAGVRDVLTALNDSWPIHLQVREP